jgi:hypothetical protein
MSLSFDAAVTQAKAAWNTVLSRVLVEDVGAGYTPQEVRGAVVTVLLCVRADSHAMP